ncbi:MAG TPA: hypothetical protein PLR35_16100 [Burkholderiaceae bacterium]|nr:hypothetical protein [Burkholderiaceae bacterium]
MKRRFMVALAALMLTGPMLASAAPDEAQKQLMQRSMEAKQKLQAAQAAQGTQRNKLMQEHMDLMGQMMKQMHSARPGPNATPQQMREWIDEHLKVMDQMMSQMMDAEHMMMGPMRGSQNMDMMKGSK